MPVVPWLPSSWVRNQTLDYLPLGAEPWACSHLQQSSRTAHKNICRPLSVVAAGHCALPVTSISSFDPYRTLWSGDIIDMLSLAPVSTLSTLVSGLSMSLLLTRWSSKKWLAQHLHTFCNKMTFFFFFLKRSTDYLKPTMLIRLGCLSRIK